MRYVRWTFWTLVIGTVVAFLHYTLPHRDIVRIVDTYTKRIDVAQNAWFWARAEVGMSNTGTSRDVFFIDAVYPNGSVITYRNEDTGWGWPPYFKIDSFGLNAKARELISGANDPAWVAVTHYGWRNNLFTIFPNAVSVRRVDGPDVRLIPWANIIILGSLAVILFMIRRMWLQFRERMIDPAVDRIDANLDLARAEARGFWGRLRGWFGGKGRPPQA